MEKSDGNTPENSEKEYFSVAVITYNEADRLARCIKSIASITDDIVVVDSGSTDGTTEIARRLGCRVISQSWLGFAKQKQFAVDQCRNDWVLILDADEVLSDETVAQLPDIWAKRRPEVCAFGFLRRNFFHGRWIRRCGWWPERVVRLVDRRWGSFSNHLVHESWHSSEIVQHLDLSLLHFSFRNYADLVVKMQHYSTLAARQMAGEGRRSNFWTPLLRGGWMFFRTYLLELGILEGFDGFMIASMNGMGSFMKYAKLREINLYGENSS